MKSIYRVADVRDLMRLRENDIKLLGRMQIKSDLKYEVCAKNFTDGIAKITLFMMWLDNEGEWKPSCLVPILEENCLILRRNASEA
ncbi:hypothetical protein Hanom_Chr05g00421291 [Helianthus anomalus]